jgi:hypothetical protein
MNVLLAWSLTGLGQVFMYPWARWLLDCNHRYPTQATPKPILLALTTVGLSTGVLSLIMMWIGLLGVRLDWRIVTASITVICAVGFYFCSKIDRISSASVPASPSLPLQIKRVASVLVLVIAILCLLILFNATYWPFSVDDAVTLYASFGKYIATSGLLPHGNLYEAYPMHVPLNYAFIFQLFGWINEYAAALIPAMLSIAVVGVAYELGCELFDWQSGLIAALLVVLAPMFTHWASTGYVDLPCGFYYGMSLLFTARLARSGLWTDAVLAGSMAGLAAWTKNSGLLIVPAIGIWFVYRYGLFRQIPNRGTTKFLQLALVIGAFVIVAGPWYLRNLGMIGALLPPTGWTWKAERTLSNLIPYLVDSHYGVVGGVFTGGFAYTLWQLWVTRARQSAAILLLFFTLPFFAIWWGLYSYDDRFLLVLTAPVAVMGASALQSVWRRLPRPARLAWLPFIIVVVFLVALPAASAAVEFKFEVLRRPLMTDAEKHELRLGRDRYRTALFLRTLPANSKVWTQDIMLPYQSDGMRMMVGLWPTDRAQLTGYDYWVLSGTEKLPEWFGALSPLHQEGTYRIFALPMH